MLIREREGERKFKSTNQMSSCFHLCRSSPVSYHGHGILCNSEYPTVQISQTSFAHLLWNCLYPLHRFKKHKDPKSLLHSICNFFLMFLMLKLWSQRWDRNRDHFHFSPETLDHSDALRSKSASLLTWRNRAFEKRLIFLWVSDKMTCVAWKLWPLPQF